MMRWLLVIVALQAGALPLEAAELRSVTLEKRDGIYYTTSEVWLSAPREELFHVLSDWNLSTRFSSLITASRNLEPDTSGRPGFYMKNKGCVLFFCQTVEREGYVVLKENYLIRAVAYPGKSDFEISDETWTLVDDGEGTKILYEMQMKPKFWIPPLIGPYAIKSKIKNDGLEALQRIEDYVNGYDQ